MAQAFRRERFATKRELNTLARLAGSVDKYFPPDYAAISVDEIQEKVMK